MILIEKTNGHVFGTGTIEFPRMILGGVLIAADGTNAATVTLRKKNGNGQVILNITTKQPMWIGAPIQVDDIVHYNVSGTGAGVELYEYAP